jgi:hypothetical protein
MPQEENICARSNSKPLDNPKIISDMENVPAYARRNVTLDETNKNSGKQNSGYMVIWMMTTMFFVVKQFIFIHNVD